MIIALCCLLPAHALAAMSIDASSRSAVLAALKSAMPALQMSTDPPAHLISTTIPTTETTVHGVRLTRTHGILSKWHESGLYWDFFYAYASLASDTSFTPVR
ncbi:hypothetical protein BJ741DRAFT_715878 [Chytriomyces cf. hyalinus JEL632]|nr:hypothetical protein BJ741DRAFT_715878 [Chytriomyces cf. hyalinus JEL632]